jgi:hypothetical protein
MNKYQQYMNCPFLASGELEVGTLLTSPHLTSSTHTYTHVPFSSQDDIEIPTLTHTPPPGSHLPSHDRQLPLHSHLHTSQKTGGKKMKEGNSMVLRNRNASMEVMTPKRFP